MSAATEKRAIQTPTLVDPRDVAFQLYELLDVEALTRRERFAEHGRETFDAAIATARALAERYFAPHNRAADLAEPHWDGTQVRMIPEVKQALDAFSAAGFMAAHAPFELGGMQLPQTVAQAAFSHFQAANLSTASYAFLTVGAANLLQAFGTEDQRRRYLAPMLAGRFLGTMALTEPQAGSSLADIRTRAVPAPDGSYRLTGSKIFISGGDHELSENIVHMVLAKIPGGPPGTRGISLFVVPKRHVLDDGSLGERNGVALAGLIHKAGYRGTTSTMLNFGEDRPCIGTLLGEPHGGLAAMFRMMNEARISVGLGATMLGYAGYLHSLDYARNRPQGRPVGAKDPAQPPVPIVAHADIRRLLLAQKAYAEGAFSLCLTAARLVDEAGTAPTEAERQEAALLLDVLTPIVKAWPAEYCGLANSHAIQVLGGYGYTREYPVEQYWRDNRLNPIHEGTNGIQAIDLLGRKVRMQDGAGFALLVREIRRSLAEAEGLDEIRTALAHALDRAIATTAILDRALTDDPAKPLANAAAYLDMLGRVVMGWIWLRQAVAARRAAARGDGDADFLAGKLHAALWYARAELPQVDAQCDLLARLDPTVWDMRDEWF